MGISKAEETRRRNQGHVLTMAAVMLEALGEDGLARAIEKLSDAVRAGERVPDFRLCDLEN